MSFARVSCGKYFATGSLSERCPCSSSIRSAVQVNCLVTEPIANIVRGVTVRVDATSATP